MRDQEERTRDMKEILNCVTPKSTPRGNEDYGRGYRKWRKYKKSLNLFATFLIFLCAQMNLSFSWYNPKINASRQVTVKVFYSICLVLDLLGENLAMSTRYS